MKNKQNYKKAMSLSSNWLGIFNFERLSCEDKSLIDEFYDSEINSPEIRKLAIEKIALPYFNEIGSNNQSGFKQALSEALTFSNEELRDAFDSSGLVFDQAIHDPHAFLVDLWNIVFPDEEKK